MTKPHDMCGETNDDPIDQSDHQKMDWEMRADALHQVLGQKGIRRTDEMRRAMESLDPDLYRSLSYYERWTAALELLMVEKGFLTSDEIDRKVTQLDQGAH